MPHTYARLEDDEKRFIRRTDVGARAGRDMVAVSGSRWNKLVLRSDKPEALTIQEWVAREVLSAIRRSEGYRLAGTAPEAVEEGTVAVATDKQSRCVNPPQKSSKCCEHDIK